MNRSSEIVTGIVQRVEGHNVFVDIGRAEAVLMATEQLPNETYNYGDTVRAYIIEVKRTSRGPQIMLSRTHPGLLKKLFELQVPEIQEGVVEIRSIAREAGSRSKVAVWSSEERVDPIGACVGPHYMRVQAVVDELAGEKIDIVKSPASWCPTTSSHLPSARRGRMPVLPRSSRDGRSTSRVRRRHGKQSRPMVRLRMRRPKTKRRPRRPKWGGRNSPSGCVLAVERCIPRTNCCVLCVTRMEPSVLIRPERARDAGRISAALSPVCRRHGGMVAFRGH